MELLQKNDFLDLLQKPEGTALSVYMPTHRVSETEGDPIKLRNLLDRAEEALAKKGLRTAEARAMLAPARELLPDALFWQHQDRGLALFITEDSFRYFNLPISPAETVVVSDEFFVKPLIPLLTADGAYYLLSLSMNHVSLYRCRRDDCRELVPADMPKSMEEALRFDEDLKQQQFHSSSAGLGTEGRTRVDAHQYHSAARGPAVFHGQGVTKDIDEDRIFRFCQAVDRAMQEVLPDEKAPLVIASVDYLRPIFRKASSYSNILDRGIDGNPDRVNPEALQRDAWDLVRPYFMQEQEKALSQYVNATGLGPSINDLAQVIPAAADGRIYTLFVAEGLERWGAYDAFEHRVILDDKPGPGSYDLIEYLVKRTISTGGTVYTMKGEDLPSPTGVAVVLRY